MSKDFWFAYMVDRNGNIRLRYRNVDKIPNKWKVSESAIQMYFHDVLGKGYNFTFIDTWKSDTFDTYEYYMKRYPRHMRV